MRARELSGEHIGLTISFVYVSAGTAIVFGTLRSVGHSVVDGREMVEIKASLPFGTAIGANIRTHSYTISGTDIVHLTEFPDQAWQEIRTGWIAAMTKDFSAG